MLIDVWDSASSRVRVAVIWIRLRSQFVSRRLPMIHCILRCRLSLVWSRAFSVFSLVFKQPSIGFVCGAMSSGIARCSPSLGSLRSIDADLSSAMVAFDFHETRCCEETILEVSER